MQDSLKVEGLFTFLSAVFEGSLFFTSTLYLALFVCFILATQNGSMKGYHSSFSSFRHFLFSTNVSSALTQHYPVCFGNFSIDWSGLSALKRLLFL